MKHFSTTDVNIKSADIKHSLFSGQCFTWNYYQKNEQKYFGVIGEDLFIFENKKDDWYTVTTTKRFFRDKDFHEFIGHYLSLDIDTNVLFPAGFKERYPDIWKLIKPYMDTKILRQNAFETLITFMCAQGLGMNIIRRQISYLSREYGKEYTVEVHGKPLTYNSLPDPETLAGIDPDSLRLCTNNNCTRAKNIIDVASSVASGQLDLESLKDPEMPLETARKHLCTYSGIGNKIADCVLLFGLHRFSAFPIDTHVRQYLAAWFSIDKALQSLTQKNYLFLQDQVSRILNPEFAGFAGHILFHSWRKEVKHLASY